MHAASAWFVGALILMAPLGAAAQDSTSDEPASDDDAVVPDPTTTFVEEGSSAETALDDPAAPLDAPQGYGGLTLPNPGTGAPRDRERVRVDVLHFDERPLTLHVASPDGSEIPAHCTAPCQLDLHPGRYSFSVQPSGGGPRRADDQPVWISGERVALQVRYDHRSGLRVAGWVFFSMAVSTLALSAIGGPFSVIIIGTPIAVAFMIPFFPLAFLEDSAQVRVTPIRD